MARLIDRKKVIRGLEICSELGSWHGLNCEDNEAYKDCPYRGCETGCVVTIAKDAIALLKEQETTFEKDGHHVHCLNCGKYWCDSDREGDPFPMNFCSNCGKAVKWE